MSREIKALLIAFLVTSGISGIVAAIAWAGFTFGPAGLLCGILMSTVFIATFFTAMDS